MNAPVTTRFAEGWPRRRFTVAEIWAMVEAGIMDEDEPVELLEGELVPMASKKNRHEIWKRELARLIITATPKSVAVAVEPSLYLSDVTFTEPDILVHPQSILPEDVRGPDALLLVEVADTSIDRDMRLKRPLYARHGVAHYWILDAENRRGFLFSNPGAEDYPAPLEIGPGEVLALPFDRSITFKLADLG
ncbi:MAG TPA: Uma2 family endonuclease [Caulobacterales bacterium]|nr:Uma2 family endonuclease [Caulobacterales bacterium]